MFGSQLRFFVVFVLALFGVAAAAAVQKIITADFRETRKDLPNSYLTGQLYYLYKTDNSGDASASRLRFKYQVPYGSSTKTVSNLYHYEYKAIYSMCGNCKAESTKERPDPWWYDSTVYQTDSTPGWYKHKTVTDSKTLQVKRIKMSSATSPAAGSIEVIEFNDGRNLTLSNMKVDSIAASSAEFKVDSGVTCPTPTCSMLADIVFVLDYSGSVSKDEWTQTSTFVIGVMNNFTFGDTAAAAACIQFNAPSSYSKYGSGKNVKCYDDTRTSTIYRYYSDYEYYAGIPGTRTASVLAGQKVGNNYTVSTNKQALITEMNKTRTPSGNTCQGLGLELAMDVFDRSPRKSYGTKLNRIVIAVTDGADHCPNRTQRAAKKLRETYGALFIGIGVGLSCDYDRHFIENLTSTLAGNPAYYPVSDYSAIKSLVDELFSPLCEEFHQSECGPDCKGLCACGDCFCPNCVTDGNLCHDNKCVARDGTASGCVDTNNSAACAASDKCTQYHCQYDYSSGKQWCTKTETCSVVASKNPGTCRKTTCKNGKCTVTRDDSICKSQHTYNSCERWLCAAENKSASDYPSGDYNEVTGCYRSLNMHKTCADRSKNKCVQYTCNASGMCEPKDLCKSDKCTTRSCPLGSNNEYGSTCKEVAVPKPDTKCTFYSCDPVNGWSVHDIKTDEECGVELFPKEEDRKCKDFTCDDNKGCLWSGLAPDQCELCNETFKGTCNSKAQQKSTAKQCYTGICKLHLNGQQYEAYCNVDDANDHENITDCTTSAAADTARELNRDNPSTCFTVECQTGLCKVVPVPRKAGEVDDNCTKYYCHEYSTGQWEWKSKETDIKISCVTDDCTDRVCVPDTGCVETDICSIRTTECKSYTCETGANGKPVCEEHNELKQYTCMREVCEDGTTKKMVPSYETEEELRELCNNSDLCTAVTCDELGECTFRSKKEIAEENDGDPCKIWSCDDNTGDVNWRFKCDDGLYCTEDKCSFDGSTCRNSPINCYLEVDMTDYPCFKAECVESPQTDSYRCVRKLKSGVYIDICGNCLRDYIPTSSESESEVEADENCIEAPEEPMLKEGLAAASIALIVLGALIIGGAMTASGVIGTKTLLERARAANNQSAHTNPLFEDNEAEMTNPTFTGEN